MDGQERGAGVRSRQRDEADRLRRDRELGRATAMNLGKAHDTIPILDSSRAFGHTKYGFGINVEHTISRNIGLFLRGSWNDGHNETFVFTEIDRALSLGISLSGLLWKMKDDNLGLAFLVNGLSADHKNFLKAGGYGFIIGDGSLIH